MAKAEDESTCGGMRRSEISDDLWTLPAQKTKNRKGHDVPLSRQALELIEQMPDVGDVIFTTDGTRPIRNFSRIKLAVDEIMKPEQPYGVYQRHNYADEKRTGLQRWADHVEAVMKGGPVGRVIMLRS